jgi:hypothetical protein
MNYLVQPVPGFGNFMGRQHVDEKKEGTENKKKHDDFSVAVYQVSHRERERERERSMITLELPSMRCPL